MTNPKPQHYTTQGIRGELWIPRLRREARADAFDEVVLVEEVEQADLLDDRALLNERGYKCTRGIPLR